MNIRISGIFARENDSVCVCFELQSDGGAHTDTQKFILSAGQLARLGLAKGECDEELFDTVAREARLYEADRRAINVFIIAIERSRMNADSKAWQIH